jgi:glyoxylase-like metal-dependent hydrolase (beta-lactamase superfamily II)
VGQYIDSLKSLVDVDVTLVLPGHGKPFNGFGRRLKQLVSLVEQMQTQALETLDGQSLTTFEVILRQKRRAEWNKLLPIEKRGYMVEMVARLQALRLDGRAEALLNNEVVSFKRKGLQSDVAQ